MNSEWKFLKAANGELQLKAERKRVREKKRKERKTEQLERESFTRVNTERN